MRVAIQTLGCKVNQSESSSIEGTLRNNDYEIVKHSDNPDLVIVNTCSVTAKSDHQSRQLVRKAVKSGAKVIATGCYAQLKSDELLKIDGLNLVVGNSDKDNLLEHINNLTENQSPTSIVGPPIAQLIKLPYYSTRSRAFLKIQDGCNFSCSYCTVPMARGKSRSLNENDVLYAVEHLVSKGYNEIVITGIHIGSYGSDLKPKSSLYIILKKMVQEYPETRFRISSIEPQEFNETLIELLGERNVCKHLHIPLQSGSDKMLKEMNRGYTSEYYKQLIHRIITAYPDISIGADVIVGYPSESEHDFNETVKFLEKLPLTYFHVFPYSKRPNTKAALIMDEIDSSIKKERVRRLIKISDEKKNGYMTKHLDKVLNVIVEKKDLKSSYYKAISDNYLRLIIESPILSPGQFLRVRVKALTEHGLIAQPL